MSGVFVNYRTGDGGFAAALLARVLAARFGQERVFLASRSIPHGEDFVQHIMAGLSRSSVLLAVIGPQWLSANGSGHRRLDDPADWVRIEIAEAFRRGVRVIPVFLDNTSVLREAELPADIAILARLQYLRLNHRNDNYDLAQLLSALTDLTPELILARVFTPLRLPVRDLNPSAWLRPDFGIVPLADRGNERADLAAWIGAAEPVSARLITGPAGQGKTRLALRLCQDLIRHGWLAGVVHDRATVGDLADAGTINKPMLFVVDNAEAHLDQVRALAAALVDRPPTAPPARLLLLNRDHGEWLAGLRTHPQDRVRNLFHRLDEHALGSLTPTVADRAVEFQRAAAAFGGFLGVSTVDVTAPADLSHSRYAQARVVHASALISLLEAHRSVESVPRPDSELLRAALPECPYRGLQPFQEQDARFFYGREAQVRTLADLVSTQPVVMVIGGSGSGKSSLVRAGLLPLLRKQNVAMAIVRPTPGTAPRDQLAHALRQIVPAEWATGPQPPDIALLADPIVAAVGQLVLFIDQFEELIAADPGAARELLDLVLTLVRAAPHRPAGAPAVRAVLTMRSADLDEILTSDTVHLVQTVPVPRMGPAELRAAVTGPAETARVVSFEPGLVERIITDAAAAPGQLPLVEFVLTRLWESQLGAIMTHEAYDRLGGVAGALATYADEVYSVRLPGHRRAGVRPLLVQLARPGDGGTFTLSPTRLDQLTPESRELAAELAHHRLVVIRHDPGHPEVVALAHEALIDLWPRLRGWLTDARDFRAWQEQLRVTLTQWQQSDHDPGTLLRGAPLVTAEDWLTRDPPGLTTAERTYIGASRAHRRRTVRRWRMVTALIAALALAAGGFATVVARQSRERADQLHKAAAVTLAQESLRRDGGNVQFAEAAWKHDPDRPETYAALLNAYVKNSGVDRIRSGLWATSVRGVDVSADHRLTAISTETGDVAVWTDLFGSLPREWSVTSSPKMRNLALSPDGRRLAIVDERGGIDLWDVEHHTGPFPLRSTRPIRDIDANENKNLRFTPDGGLLIATRKPGAFGYTSVMPDIVEVWDTERRQPVPHGIQPAADSTEITVKRVEPDGRSAWFEEYHDGDKLQHTVWRDLTTGAVIREYQGLLHVVDDTLIECGIQADGLEKLTVRDLDSAAVRFTTTVSGCPAVGGIVDLTRRYAALVTEGSSASFQMLYLIDLHTAQTYRLQTPAARINERSGLAELTGSAAVPNKNGGLDVFGLTASGLLRFHPAMPVHSTWELYNTGINGFTNQNAMAVRPDGRVLAIFHSDQDLNAHQSKGPLPRIEIFELDSQRLVVGRSGTSATALRLSPYPTLTYSPDGRRLLALGSAGELVVLSAADLTVTRRIPLPTPPLEPSDGARGWNTSIIPVSNDEVVVLHAGALTRWRIDSGEERGELLAVRPDRRQLRIDAPGARAFGMPGQPGNVIIAIRDRVELWDLDQRRAIRHFQPWPEKQVTDIIVNPRTSQVAVYFDSVGRLELWNPERDGATRPSIPAGLDNFARPLKGFTEDNKLITNVGIEGDLLIWDLDKGVNVGGFKPSGFALMWEIHDNILLSPTQRGPVFIDMTPQHWTEHLCQINDRDYTTEERALLPPGADPIRPCH